MLDVLPDGRVRLLRPVNVHVIDGRRLGRLDRLIESPDVVIVIFWVVGLGVLLDEPPQIRVGLVAGVIPSGIFATVESSGKDG